MVKVVLSMLREAMSYAINSFRIYFEKNPSNCTVKVHKGYVDLTEKEDGTLGILQSSENNGTGVNCCLRITNIICSNSAEVTKYGTAKLRKSFERCVMNHIILSWAESFTEGHYIIFD